MNDLDISRLQSIGIATRPTTRETSELGQDDFLRIMLAQLENQDPTSPLEGNEFLSQITQFSIADGVSGLNESFADLANSLTSNQALQASALVGRSVLVPGDSAGLSENGTLQGQVALPNGASSVTVDIFNLGGELVNSINLGPQVAGNVDFVWNGVTNNGEQAEPGTYRVAARANVGGTQEALSTLISARVDSVTLQNGGGSLEINLAGIGPVSFSSVQEIR
ncbi:MAG: flagellar hook assembly protein FlgD [Gammaproteobacteria bacterium]|nr:flagellar hook assembly protein FlgD [Gammaproteobacteria bacterium]